MLLSDALDSYGDLLTYLTLPPAVWLHWPEIVEQQRWYIVAAVSLCILPALVSLRKFGRLAS